MSTANSQGLQAVTREKGDHESGKWKCIMEFRGELVYFVLIWRRLKFCFMLVE